jgi:hypothetical protein
MRSAVVFIKAALCISGLVPDAGGVEPQRLTVDERLERIDECLRHRPAFLNQRFLQEFRSPARLRSETIEEAPNLSRRWRDVGVSADTVRRFRAVWPDDFV